MAHPSCNDEEKKESDDDAGRGGGGGRSLAEQRAARMRRRRVGSSADGGGRRRTHREAAISDATPDTEALVKAAEDAGCDGGEENGAAEGYTTAYTSIRRKYPHHAELMQRGGVSGLDRSLRYQTAHRREQKSREALGVKLIRQRWESELNGRSNLSSEQRRCRQRTDGGYRETNADDMTDSEECAMQPTLVYRKTNVDYSIQQRMKQIAFLNERTLLAVDSRGELNVIGLPLSLSGGNRMDGGCGSSHNGGGGAGTLLSRMSISPSMNDDDRQDITHYNVELYGYQRGEKFVVGLPSGQMQLFSLERLGAYGGCIGRQAGAQSDSSAVWHCVQSVGPRRRFRRNNQFPLAGMFSLSREALLEAFNGHGTFEEIPGWDTNDFCLDRGNDFVPSWKRLWAFKEGSVGGGSGTALVGALVDPEFDSFSLRVIDERVGSSASCTDAGSLSAQAHVFVDTSTSSRSSILSDQVTNICFSGEHGLVTSHQAFGRQNYCENTIKWWDHRMLCGQPINVMNPVFPRDDVSGVCSATDMEQMGSFINLVGSNDSSDRIALVSHGQVDIVDSSRGQTVQTETVAESDASGISDGSGIMLPCFSSQLDFMAHRCREFDDTTSKEAEFISLYDVSRHSPRSGMNRNHSSSESFGGRKRRADCLRSDDPSEMEDTGLLGRIRTNFKDGYGIDSNASCMAMDELGSSVACGTEDGDVFVYQGL